VATFTQFFPEVLPYVPDVAEPVAENAIRQAVIEFCERTRFWQEDLDAVPVIAKEGIYEIDTDRGVKFVDVMMGYYDDRLLIPKSAEELSNLFRRSDWRTLVADPYYVTRINPTEVQLVPRPAFRGSRLKIRAALAPTRDSTTVADAVYEEYLEVVAAGARARLYNTPKQPYFDRAVGQEYERRFRAGINEARIRVNKSLTRTSGRVEFQRFL